MKARFLKIPWFATAFLLLLSCGDSNGTGGDADVDEQEQPADTAGEDLQTDPAPDGPGDPHYDVPADEVSDHADHAGDPVPDPPPDAEEDPAEDPAGDVPEEYCTIEGCLLPAEGRCCPGLDAVHECDPASGELECEDRFCVDCGNDVCDPHENCYNCLADCTAPCRDGDSATIVCSMIETHHCTCTPDPCPPECRTTPDGGQAWYDSCDGRLIRADDGCMAQTPECRAVCSRSEGWYESGTDELIEWDFCRSEWECTIVW
jgi:hypothetical protein